MTWIIAAARRLGSARRLPRLLVALVAIAGGSAHLLGQSGAARGPIRIGFMAPLSGAYAQNGRDIQNGFLLYLDEIGYQAAGRKIEVITEDEEAIPAVGLTKARKLVERDRVHIMAGTLLSSTGYALAPYIDSQKIPMIYPVVSADDLTQRRRTSWIVRTGWNASQPNHAFGEYAYKRLGYRRIATISLDYAFGWESVGGFQRTFEAEGGKIVQKLWAPVSVHDFAPYLAQIPRDVDAVYALVLGRAALQLMRQYEEFGLRGRVPLIGGGTSTDEHVLPFMGDEATGVITALHYSGALDNPANTTFAKAYRARFHKIPSYYGESMYTGAKWLVAAIERVNGNVEDAQGLMDALRAVTVTDVPRGPVRLDEYGSPVQNIYIRRVDRVNGELQNTVIETLPAVSQFWKYAPAEYLARPLYSRRYQ